MEPHGEDGQGDAAEEHVGQGQRDDEWGGHVTSGSNAIKLFKTVIYECS
jgi:hypothetical protein